MGYVKSVLLIEDDKDLRLNLEYFLSKIGYRLLVAGTGEEGIEVWERERPRAVLLDVHLPGMNGYRVCESIRSRGLNGETAILFLSGRPERELLAAGQRGGADFYIQKPADPVDLGSDLYHLFERDFNMSLDEILKLRVARKVPKPSRPTVPPPDPVTVLGQPASDRQPSAWIQTPSARSEPVRKTPSRSASSFQEEKWDHLSELMSELRQSLRRKHFHSMSHDELLDLAVDTERRVDAVIEYVELVHYS
jgi:DNA-binding response OmpR family regulator